METNSTTTLSMIKHFDWVEYLVFSSMLAVSLLIGLYFGCYKGGQNNVSEYLLGSRKMSLFPVTMSLISSQISGITLLGVPTEVYRFGTQYIACFFTAIGCSLVTSYIFLPVFYKLQLISLYKYLELRFSRNVRVLASLLFALSTIFYIPIVIYGPAIVLNQGLNIHIVTPIICATCIIYTTLGGLKAVVWTDAVQGVAMVFAVFSVVILGVIRCGGISAIFQKAYEGNRIELFNFDPDPTARMSVWTIIVGLTFSWVSFTSINPSVVQRFISLPTYREAQLSVYYLAIGAISFITPSIFLGVILYAVYKDCDPLSAKVIDRPDQILPYFVLDVSENIRGLSGLFVVGICSAALSTMSTGLNTIAGTLFEDFIEPHFPKMSEEKSSFIMKVLVVVTGAVCVALVFVVDKMGAILEMSYKFGGITAGSTLGIFVLGLLFPSTNEKGAFFGGIASLCVMTWITVGNHVATTKGYIYHPTKPISVEGCGENITQLVEPKIMLDEAGGLWTIYKISVFYYCMVGCIVVLVVGLIISYLTGPTNIEDIDQDLLSPLVRRNISKKNYSSLPLKEVNGNMKEAT